jgi:asparagine synthase (glutamine-hydrolysing)
MCGIVGVIGPRATPALAKAMCAAIIHRGPDSDGFYARPGVALGMRRLSIIDLASGDQPIHNENRVVWTVYNGEIYNFPSLKKELEALGHKFYTRTDTELLVHCYEEYGTGLCGPLRGMFAFALWDESKQQLIVARDRLGKKPLYYAQVGDTLFIASEIKALLRCDDVPRKIDSISVDQYFTLGYVPGPRTMYEGIFKLLPGHLLVFSRGLMQVSKYWEMLPASVETPNGERAEEWLEWLETQLDEAVRLRLISDVPLGAFLSGGLDSSLVVALMRRHVTGRLKTFSVAFDESGDYDERQHAKAIASHFETDHHELVAGGSPPDLLTKVVWHLDEPIADPAAVPTYLVSREARRHVKVVLTGEGADELFAGYGRYSYVQRLHDIQSRLPHLLVRAGRALFPLIPDGGRRGIWVERARKVMSGLFLPPGESYTKYALMTEHFYRTRLYSQGFKCFLAESETAKIDPRLGHFSEVADQTPLNQALFVDTKTWLPDELLMKVDKMSMANSLEARAPYLDHHLVEGAFRMPDSLKVRNGVFKYILRRLGQGILPQSIWRRQKHGFIVPYREWFSGPLKSFVYDVLTSGKIRQHELFDAAGVRQQLKSYFDRKEQGEKETRALWALLCFQIWYESGTANRSSSTSSCALAGTLANAEIAR